MKVSPKLWCLFNVHEYEESGSANIRYINLGGHPTGETGHMYYFTCRVCGKFKKVRS